MQHKKVMVYASHQLKPHEQKYPMHDLEWASIIFTLKIRKHLWRKIKIYTDHKTFKYIFI